jgi:hypothetical protein
MSFAWRSHLPLLLVPLLACSPDKDPLDSVSAGPTGGPTGGSNSGGSNSGGSNSGGSNSGSSTDDPTGTGSAGTATTGETGGSGVHPSCEQWLQCVNAVDPANYPMVEQTYGPNSTCWQLTPEIEQMCIEACEDSLASYGMTYPDEPACGGAGGTSTGTTTNTTRTTETTLTTQTSETDPSETGGSDYGNCGWDAGNGYYACGFGGQVDPEGISPIDCPDPLPASGEPCSENGPVDGIGCCTPSGVNYYCGGDMTVTFDECVP